MALPFYITYEKKDKELSELVNDVFMLFETIGEVVIPRENMGSGSWSNGDFGSVSWYVHQTKDLRRRQVHALKLLNLFDKEPWQKTSRRN